jgi:hypothetical protein
MKAATWKAVFAAMSPSPVFQAVAEFAEARADLHRRAPFNESQGVVDLRSLTSFVSTGGSVAIDGGFVQRLETKLST